MINNIIEFVRNSAIVSIAVATPLFMVANSLGGIILAEFNGDYDGEVVKKSIIKYVSILGMGGLIYVGGKLSNTALIELVNIDLGIDIVVTVGLATLTGKYAVDAVGKFIELTGASTHRPEVKVLSDNKLGGLVIEIDADTSKITEKLEELQKKTEEINNG